MEIGKYNTIKFNYVCSFQFQLSCDSTFINKFHRDTARIAIHDTRLEYVCTNM